MAEAVCDLYSSITFPRWIGRTDEQISVRNATCICDIECQVELLNQFLLVVKASALKQQISKLYPLILSTEASDHIYACHKRKSYSFLASGL